MGIPLLPWKPPDMCYNVMARYGQFDHN